MSLLGKSAVVLSLSWLLMPLGFLTNALVARAVGPEGKGVLLLLAGLTALVGTLAGAGVSSAAAHQLKAGRYTLGQIAGACVVLLVTPTLLAFSAFALLSDAFVRVFVGQGVFASAWIWLSLASVIPSLLAANGDVLLIVSGDMRRFALRGAGIPLLGIGLTWALALALRLGVTGVLLSQLAASVVGVLVLVHWLAGKGAFRQFVPPLALCREMFFVSIQQYAVSFVATVAKRFDAFLISALLTTKDAGYFAVAVGLQATMLTLPGSTMWPLVSSLSGADADRRANLAGASRILVALMLLGAAAAAVLAPVAVPLVFGQAFAPAVPAVWLLLPSVVVAPVTICANALFTAQGRPGRSLLAGVIGTAAQITVSLILVPRLGMRGSAVGLSVNYVVTAAVQLFVLVRSGEVGLVQMLVPSRQDLALARVYAAGVARRLGILATEPAAPVEPR